MGTGEPGSSIAKDLIDSEDPNIRCFVAKTCNYDIFVAEIYDYALIDSF